VHDVGDDFLVGDDAGGALTVEHRPPACLAVDPVGLHAELLGQPRFVVAQDLRLRREEPREVAVAGLLRLLRQEASMNSAVTGSRSVALLGDAAARRFASASRSPRYSKDLARPEWFHRAASEAN